MKAAKVQAVQGRRGLQLLIHILCALAVMAAAVLVRMPSEMFQGVSENSKAAYTADSGTPYLTDMDSYYHVRLVRNYLENGKLGNTTLEDGTDWDSLRYAPEGKSTDYQPGIIWLTAFVWRLFGGSLDALEYRLMALVAAFSALAAYWVGQRLGGPFGGITAGLLVGCGPTYAQRSCFGRFDTDVLIVLMEVLLILFLTEALRTSDRRKRVLHILGFTGITVLYPLFWEARYAALFIGLTLLGGVLAVIAITFADPQAWPKSAGAFFRSPAFCTLAACCLLAAAGLMLTSGISVFSSVFSTFTSFSTSSSTGSGVLPNLFASISELNKPKLFPAESDDAFLGYIPGQTPAIVNGVGGVFAVLLSLAGLCCLVIAGIPRRREAPRGESGRASAVYACILGVWWVAGFFLTRFGVRFLEHLSIPVGMLAAAFIGQVLQWLKKIPAAKPLPKKFRFPVRQLVPLLLCAAAVVPAVTGSARAVAGSRPSVTDASANTMAFLRENAQEPDAVIASWWDMGYYYESEANLPCLWDGGSQNGARAIWVAQALVADDLDLSRRILLMLSGSGDAAVKYLTQHTDTKTAFESIREALLLDQEQAAALLRDRCALTEAEAREVEALIHPAQPRETYLVLTYTMTQQIGWYEYYANWDFTGTQALPAATLYSYTPSGTPLFNTESGEAYLDSIRGKETLWQLFFAAVQTPCFTPVYEWHDGLEHVRIWRVEP